MESDEADRHFMDRPEVHAVFDAVNDLVSESDRGALMMCTEFVSDQLAEVFRHLAPESMNGCLKRLLGKSGILSSFGARQDVSGACGFIGPDLYKAIESLRKLRNDAAHSKGPFRLRDHWERVRRIYDLGTGVPAGINRWACEYLVHNAIQNVLDATVDVGDGERPIFESPGEVIDWMRRNSEELKPLDERLPRLELGLATAMICAMIILHRDRTIAKRDGSKG